MIMIIKVMNVEHIWLTSLTQQKSRFSLMISISRYTLTDSMTGVLILKPSLSCFRLRSCFQVYQVWGLGEERHSILQLPRLRSHLCPLCEAAHMRHQHQPPLTPPLTSSSSPILDNLYLSRLHFYLLLNLLFLHWHFPTSHIHRTYDGKMQFPKNDLLVLTRHEIIAHLKHRACTDCGNAPYHIMASGEGATVFLSQDEGCPVQVTSVHRC